MVYDMIRDGISELGGKPRGQWSKAELEKVSAARAKQTAKQRAKKSVTI